MPLASRTTAVVVGGGIAGLAAALALGGGWDVLVLEQSSVFWEAGAGLTLTANGRAAAAALGIGAAVEAAGVPVTHRGITGPDARVLVPIDGLHGLSIHRRSLHGALVAAASLVSELELGARVTSIRPEPRGGATVAWDIGGERHERRADLVVKADGAGRRLEQGLPDKVLERGQYSAWRAVVEDTQLPADLWSATWRDGVEFAVQRIAPNRVSWHCLARTDSPAFDGPGDRLAERLAAWPAPDVELIQRTARLATFRHDIVALRRQPPWLRRDSVVLVGDAAHPVLPTIGQGANLALEDAVALGRLVRPGALEEGLAAFEVERSSRGWSVARQARQLARWGLSPNSLGARPPLRLALPGQRMARGWRAVTQWQA